MFPGSQGYCLILILVYVLFSETTGALKDGRYYIQYDGKNGCKGKYLSYTPNGLGIPAGVRLNRSPALWQIQSKGNGSSTTFEAVQRPLSSSAKLGYSSSCSSSSVLLRRDGMLTWTLSPDKSGSRYNILASKKSRVCGTRFKGSLDSKDRLYDGRCTNDRLHLAKTSASGSNYAKWRLIPTTVPSPPPPPPSPPPIAETRRCPNPSPYFNHYDFETTQNIYNACLNLWRVDPDLLIPSGVVSYAPMCANVGSQITCRSDSHETGVGEWSGPPRIQVCDSVELAASSLDVGDIDPGCGLYFWCTNPSVGINNIQWIIQMKQTYDF
eukprot:jgi/Picsp_1/784/NSC_04273-R1_---NA---